MDDEARSKVLVLSVGHSTRTFEEFLGIAMGSRGRGGIRRALMGNVSERVVRHAHGAVMIVRG